MQWSICAPEEKRSDGTFRATHGRNTADVEHARDYWRRASTSGPRTKASAWHFATRLANLAELQSERKRAPKFITENSWRTILRYKVYNSKKYKKWKVINFNVMKEAWTYVHLSRNILVKLIMDKESRSNSSPLLLNLYTELNRAAQRSWKSSQVSASCRD